MRRGRLFILIAALLTLLVLGAALMHPLVRFTLALHLEGFDRAESVYLSRIQSSEKLDGAAREQLRRYVAKTAAEYYSGALTYAETMDRLVPLSQRSLPQDHIAPALQAVREMEFHCSAEDCPAVVTLEAESRLALVNLVPRHLYHHVLGRTVIEMVPGAEGLIFQHAGAVTEAEAGEPVIVGLHLSEVCGAGQLGHALPLVILDRDVVGRVEVFQPKIAIIVKGN